MKLNRLVAFVWLVLIGTSVAAYYSGVGTAFEDFIAENAPAETGAYLRNVVLLGAAYFLLLFRTQFLRLLSFNDFLFILLLFVVPIFLMVLSERSFDFGDYTSQISCALVFIVASIIGMQTELNRPVLIAAYAIVVVGSGLNLYELFFDNNLWSIAPGRSAGFYVNPNITAGALVGYAMVYLTARFDRVRRADVILLALLILGVLTTFSRAGILACLVLVMALVFTRVGSEFPGRKIFVAAIILFSTVALAQYMLQTLELSEDAITRMLSLRNSGGIGDYGEERGAAAINALDLVVDNLLFGNGVRTIYSMEEGPHNMFVAMLVDYGIVGLIAYLVVIARLMLIARRADRNLSGMIWAFVTWLVIFSFVSHNLLDTLVTLPLMGFALARAYKIHSLSSQGE